MKQGACLAADCGCFGISGSASVLLSGNFLSGGCCISWSRQTPSTRPVLLLRGWDGWDGGICNTVAEGRSISDVLPALRRLFLGRLPCDGAPLSGCHVVAGARNFVWPAVGPCKETPKQRESESHMQDRERERVRELQRGREREREVRLQEPSQISSRLSVQQFPRSFPSGRCDDCSAISLDLIWRQPTQCATPAAPRP